MDLARTDTRILVVEDDLDLADMLQELFRAAGYDMAVAYDGPTALSQAASFLPQIILMDIHMPTTDGHELCRRLRAQPARLPRIVAVTSDVRIDETQVRAAGFDGFLLEPIDLERALQLLERLGSPDAQSAAPRASAAPAWTSSSSERLPS